MSKRTFYIVHHERFEDANYIFSDKYDALKKVEQLIEETEEPDGWKVGIVEEGFRFDGDIYIKKLLELQVCSQ